jgi:hypothetical protein
MQNTFMHLTQDITCVGRQLKNRRVMRKYTHQHRTNAKTILIHFHHFDLIQVRLVIPTTAVRSIFDNPRYTSLIASAKSPKHSDLNYTTPHQTH